MATERLTQARVDALAGSGQSGRTVADGACPGLRVRAAAGGASYQVRGRLGGRAVTITLGRTAELSLATARELASEARARLRRGEDPRGGRGREAGGAPTVAEAFEDYLSLRGPELTERTVGWYREKLRNALAPLADVPVDRVDRAACAECFDRATRERGRTAANHAMRALKAVLNDQARRMDGLPPNPVSRLRLHRERPRDSAVPLSGLSALWAEVDSVSCLSRRSAWALLLLTGLRVSELCSLRWEDLDWGDRVVTVRRTKMQRSFRRPVSTQAFGILEGLRPLHGEWVLPNERRDGPLRGLRRGGGVEAVSPHGMRHTWRTCAAEAGVPFDAAAYLLDHSLPGVSHRYVTRANLTGYLRDQDQAVADLIWSHRRR